MVIIHLLPLLKEKTDLIPIETLSQRIKETKEAALWHELKLNSFIRPVVSIYLTTLMSCFTTLQLSLLARKTYVDSISKLQGDDTNEVNGECGGCVSEECMECCQKETERSFLTLSWFILNVGYKSALMTITAAATKALVQPLKTPMSFENICEILTIIRAEVDISDLASWIMPAEGHEAEFLHESGFAASVGKSVKELIDETRDFVESDQFKLVLTKCLDVAFQHYAETIAPQFYPPSNEIAFGGKLEFEAGMPLSPETAQESLKFPLVRILPFLNTANNKAVYNPPFDVCKRLMQVLELKTCAVIVYTGWE
jgi:peroxin-3